MNFFIFFFSISPSGVYLYVATLPIKETGLFLEKDSKYEGEFDVRESLPCWF